MQPRSPTSGQRRDRGGLWHGPQPATAGTIPAIARAGLQSASWVRRHRGRLAWPSSVDDGRLKLLHARYSGVAAGLWSTIRAGSWLWLSRRTSYDAVSRGHWNAAADSDCANADTRPRASHSHARSIGTRRCRARGSWILLFFPYGNALAVRHARRVSGSPEADRQLSKRTYARAAKPAVSADEARPRLTEITLGSMGWPVRSDR